MDNCKYYYNETGKDVDLDNIPNDVVKIGNERDLDGYLYDHRDDFVDSVESVDVTSELKQLNPNATGPQVSNFIQSLNTEASRWNSNPRAVSVTKIWDSVDPDNFAYVESFEELKRKEVIETLHEVDPSFNENTPEGEQRIQNELKLNSRKNDWVTKVGDEVGMAFEIALKKGVSALSTIPIKKDLFPTEAQSMNFYNSLAKTITGVINELKFRFPNATWLTEQSLFTDQFTDKLRGIISTVTGKPSGDISGILGRVDITGILPDGSVVTIELKTSKNKLPSTWDGNDGTYPKRTLTKYSAQVLTYDIIRKQHGIRSTPYILNMHRGDDGTLKFDRLLEVPAVEGRGRFESIVSEGLPLRSEVKIETVDEVNTEMSTMFGSNASVATELAEITRDIEFFLDRKNDFVKDVDDSMPNAKKAGYKFYFVDKRTSKHEIIYAKDEKELRDNVKQYLEDLDRISSTAWVELAGKFKTIKTIDSLRETLINLGYKGQAVDTITNHLSKYVLQKWELVNNPALIANGMLVFRGKGTSEIVMLEEIKGLFDYHKFPNVKNGTTILGMKYSDSETGSGNRHILSSQYGNLMLVKAMAIVAKHPEVFKHCKIAKISAINPRHGEINDNTMNSTLLHNWKLLAATFKELDLPIVDHVFMDDIDSCVTRARQYVKMCEDCTINNANGSPITIGNVDYMQIFKMKPDGAQYTYEEILKMRKALVGVFGGERSDKMDARTKAALDALDEALLAISNMHIFVEKDNPEYFDKGFAVTGSYMTPFYRSTSANLRLIHEISDAFHYKMNELIQQYTTPFQIKLGKALEKNENYQSALGGEYVMSEEWFVKDENGKIHKSFRLKPPTDPYFEKRQEERELLEYVLETFAALRWPGKNVNYKKADPESDYYEMPLYESDFLQAVVTSDEGIKGVGSLLKKRIKRTLSAATDLIMGREVNIADATSDEVLNRTETDDPFVDSHRKKKLEQYGPDAFTKNIDEIFLYTVIASMKRQVSETMVPQFNAVRHLIHKANEDNKAGMDAIEIAIKQYIGTVIFDKSGVKTNLLAYQKLIQILRQMFSVTTLGLNPKALTRDSISSSLRSAITFLNGKDGRSLGISADSYFDAFTTIAHNMDSIFTSHGYWNQLNLIHRVANMSYREIADQLKTHKFAAGNIDSSFFFLTTTAPDYVHRMAVLKAYLDKIGATNAYVMDDDGVVRYHMEKDARWKILYKYKSRERFSANDRANVPVGKERDEYDKAWIQYVESIEAWKKSRPTITIGDDLPLALDPIQEMSMRSVSNNMYGAYDKDAQALVNQTLLGGAFFQFKTYGITRLIDWWRSAGQINILQNSTLVDGETGEEWWEVLCSAEEMEQTGQYSKLVLKKNVSSEDIASGKAQPFRVQSGAIDEGRIQSAWVLATAAYGMYYADDEKTRKEWEGIWERKTKDPMTRLNILRALMDTFTSLLIYGFIRIVYPEEALENMNDQDWWTRWSYAVATGVASDGPIWSVFNSIWGGGQIPVVSGISRWMTSAWSVLNGDQFLPAMFNTFGATRELTAMFKDI